MYFWLNVSPHKDGIHNRMSHRAMVTQSWIDYNKHCMLEFGTYAQVHKQYDNSLLPQTTGVMLKEKRLKQEDALMSNWREYTTKRKCELTNSVFGSHDDFMCSRCKRE